MNTIHTQSIGKALPFTRMGALTSFGLLFGELFVSLGPTGSIVSTAMLVALQPIKYKDVDYYKYIGNRALVLRKCLTTNWPILWPTDYYKFSIICLNNYRLMSQ